MAKGPTYKPKTKPSFDDVDNTMRQYNPTVKKGTGGPKYDPNFKITDFGTNPGRRFNPKKGK